jgi:hypothetical protein
LKLVRPLCRKTVSQTPLGCSPRALADERVKATIEGKEVVKVLVVKAGS